LKSLKLKDFKYTCLEDGNTFTRINRLTRHLKGVLNIDPEDYYKKHIKKCDSEGFCKWCKTPTRFKNVRDGYDKFCYNTSCNVLWYNKHENRAKNCAEKIRKTHLIGDRLPSQEGYWLKRGHTQEEAYKKVRETQATNAVDSIMERKKCSLEEAVQIRAEITDKWLKSFKRMNYSMISQKLFVEVWKRVKDKYKNIYFATLNNGEIVNDGKNHEFRVKTFRSSRKIDFYIKDINKCIEFDGTYWHGKKGKGASEELLRESEIIGTLGCKVLHVKEKDFNNDNEKIIEDCVNFLNS
jgi:very-short-patch-repair endonuclease